MRRYGIAALLMVLLAGTACGALGERNPRQKVLGYLLKTERQARSFVYQEEAGGREALVRGTVEDDLRWSSTLSFDGVDVLEEIVSDDALALRVIDASKIPDLSKSAESEAVLNALRSGQWVLDYSGAPPLLAPSTKTGSLTVGENTTLDAVYIIQYVRKAIADAVGVREFNPDALDYRPQDDPFEAPNKELGIKRYDVVPPPLPRRSARGTEAALPDTAHFRKMSFFIRDGEVVKIVERIDFENHPDFRRAREGRGPKYPLELLEAVRAGKTREPIRIRTISYEVSRLGQPVKVELPIQNVVTLSLGGLFGPKGLTSSTAGGGPAPEESPPPAESDTGQPPSGG